MSPTIEKSEHAFPPRQWATYLRFSEAHETWLETQTARESVYGEDVELGRPDIEAQRV